MIKIWVIDIDALLVITENVVDRVLWETDLKSIMTAKVKADDNKYEWFSSKEEALEYAIRKIEHQKHTADTLHNHNSVRYEGVIKGLRELVPQADTGNLVNFVTRSGTK